MARLFDGLVWQVTWPDCLMACFGRSHGQTVDGLVWAGHMIRLLDGFLSLAGHMARLLDGLVWQVLLLILLNVLDWLISLSSLH